MSSGTMPDGGKGEAFRGFAGRDARPDFPGLADIEYLGSSRSNGWRVNLYVRDVGGVGGEE